MNAVRFGLGPAPMADLLASLNKRIGRSPGVYTFEPAVLDLSQWTEADVALHQPDFPQLVAVFRQAQVNLIEILGKLPGLEDLAESCGLRHAESVADEAPSESARSGDSAEPKAQQAPSIEISSGPTAAATPPSAAIDTAEAEKASSESAPETPSKPTIRHAVHIDHPVRSGQKHYAQQADLIVVNQVSGGAEVIADGDVHVYGVLRGRALAGAGGNSSARIVSTCFEPELVSIAGYYLTFEGGFPEENRSKPTLVFLDTDVDPPVVRLKSINIR